MPGARSGMGKTANRLVAATMAAQMRIVVRKP